MKFSDIPGHDGVKQRLRALADNDRLPHALLIHGRPGVGKMSMARALAAYIHCTDRRDGDSCGVCPACRQHQSLNHIDTHYSYPVLKINGRTTTVSDDWNEQWREFLANNPYMDFGEWLRLLENVNGQPRMYVEESADIMRKLNFTSHTGRQIVIMWLPERMGEECANKMLKLIEEPLGDAMFIMVSNDPESILPTIFSRTQRVEMLRLDDDTVTRYIETKYSMPHGDAAALAHLADGSILQADYRVSNMKRQQEFLDLFMRLMRLAYQKRVADLRVWANEVAALGREGSIDFLGYCLDQVRENFVYSLGIPGLNYMTVDETSFARNFHKFINERNVLELTSRLEQAIRDIRANGNGKIIMFDFAVRVIMLLRR
ncbi:MAG: AAA family ATPase [Muribaculaceae bacterium]|nr:AAA family ATPase [Muribaculaceae bacterium]